MYWDPHLFARVMVGTIDSIKANECQQQLQVELPSPNRTDPPHSPSTIHTAQNTMTIHSKYVPRCNSLTTCDCNHTILIED